MRRFLFLTPAILLALAAILVAPVAAQSADDTAGVEAAVEDYLLGIYDVEPERMERSVSKDLVKFGYFRPSAEAEYRAAPMNYEQLHRLASQWNVDNRQGPGEDTPREIEVLDVLDKTAAAKLTAHWGVDYFQLEKIDGKWMIRHVHWQSPPAGSWTAGE